MYAFVPEVEIYFSYYVRVTVQQRRYNEPLRTRKILKSGAPAP